MKKYYTSFSDIDSNTQEVDEEITSKSHLNEDMMSLYKYEILEVLYPDNRKIKVDEKELKTEIENDDNERYNTIEELINRLNNEDENKIKYIMENSFRILKKTNKDFVLNFINKIKETEEIDEKSYMKLDELIESIKNINNLKELDEKFYEENMSFFGLYFSKIKEGAEKYPEAFDLIVKTENGKKLLELTDSPYELIEFTNNSPKAFLFMMNIESGYKFMRFLHFNSKFILTLINKAVDEYPMGLKTVLNTYPSLINDILSFDIIDINNKEYKKLIKFIVLADEYPQVFEERVDLMTNKKHLHVPTNFREVVFF